MAKHGHMSHFWGLCVLSDVRGFLECLVKNAMRRFEADVVHRAVDSHVMHGRSYLGVPFCD